MNAESLILYLQEAFGDLRNEINVIIGIILQRPENFDKGAWGIITSIHRALLPVGYSLASLFFMIDFLNKSIMFEFMKWENVIKCLLKLILVKFVIENSFALLNLIFLVVADIIRKISFQYRFFDMHGANIDSMIAEIHSMSWYDRIFFYMSVQPWAVAMEFVRAAIFIIAYGRLIELYLLSALAPLPLSTLAGEGTQNIAKRFLQTYFAVCFQGVVILLGCLIYGAMLSNLAASGDGWEAMKNMVLMSFVLLVIILKSGTWAKQLTGLM